MSADRWWERARARELPTEVVNGESRDVRRCPDCGRVWRVEEIEAAYEHVMAGCPEKPWAGLR